MDGLVILPPSSLNQLDAQHKLLLSSSQFTGLRSTRAIVLETILLYSKSLRKFDR